jgi:hypothetical protein
MKMISKMSFALLGMVLLLSSCDKLTTDVNLDLKQSVANIKLILPQITDSMVGTEITFAEQMIYLNVDSVLAANNIEKSAIKSIYLKDAVVTLDADQSVTDFSFIDYINLSFREESTTYKQVGNVTNAELAGNNTFSIKFPDSATDPTNAINLVDYFGKTNFYVTMVGKATTATTDRTKTTAVINYVVTYKP